MFTAADWIILAVVVVSGGVSLFRGFIREVVSLTAWISAFFVCSKFYEPLAGKLTYFTDDVVRKTLACIILFVVTLFVVGLCGKLISSLVSSVGLSGTDRLIGMVFGVGRGILIVCVCLALLQIGFKLHILSFVADAPVFRDSMLIPELQRVVNWFFTYTPDLKNLPETASFNLGA